MSPIHPEDLNLSLFRYLFFASMVFNMTSRRLSHVVSPAGHAHGPDAHDGPLFHVDFPRGALELPYGAERPSHDVRRLPCESLLLALT